MPILFEDGSKHALTSHEEILTAAMEETALIVMKFNSTRLSVMANVCGLQFSAGGFDKYRKGSIRVFDSSGRHITLTIEYDPIGRGDGQE